MSGIAGIVRLGSDPLAPELFQRMVEALAYWGPDGCSSQQSHDAAFAYFHFASTPEAAFERQPRTLATGDWLVAAARLDNRAELCNALRLGHDLSQRLTDGDLVERAYLQWGQGCVNHLIGDWSFAVWNPEHSHLFLARDHCGNSGLYYHANSRYLAFASGRKALLALDPALHAIDDLYIAQVLFSWPVYHGARTAHTQINRLPPSHTLSATSHHIQTHRYWRMEEIEPLALRSLDEAVEGFHEVFGQAVGDRLRSNGPIGVSLSGGLDSGSITAIAASLLDKTNTPLAAYTSVPITGQIPTHGSRFGDEWELAAATATYAGVKTHRAIRAEHVSPLEGVADMLWVHDELQHAAGSGYWRTAMLQQAKIDGIKVLLTGQSGNANISWSGNVPRENDSRGRANLYNVIKKFFFKMAPKVGVQLRIWQMARQERWRSYGSINPDFVHRVRAIERSVHDPAHPVYWDTQDGLASRLALLAPGRSFIGAFWHESSAAYGLDVRDPTLDIRLIRYCLAVPEHLYYDARSGVDRMLIRQAMLGWLPDNVRLNRQRGFQGADVAFRLRNEAPAVTAVLDQLARGPAADYLNMTNLQQAWARIQQRDDMQTYRDAVVVLLRGIMAGLFIQQPHYPRPRPILAK